jgi:phenylacetate-coenzyme A ligase PaaK-like adenylate-forming protein
MYRKRMDSSSVAPNDIAGLDDIVKLPFTEKGA